MGKPLIKSNPRTQSVFDDLEKFLEFCRSYGYRFNEGDLYNWKSYAYQQFNKFLNNKPAKDMWAIDADRRGR
jgi:hypothetical protein